MPSALWSARSRVEKLDGLIGQLGKSGQAAVSEGAFRTPHVFCEPPGRPYARCLSVTSAKVLASQRLLLPCRIGLAQAGRPFLVGNAAMHVYCKAQAQGLVLF